MPTTQRPTADLSTFAAQLRERLRASRAAIPPLPSAPVEAACASSLSTFASGLQDRLAKSRAPDFFDLAA